MNELQERILKSMDLTRQLSEEEIHEAIDLRMKEEIRKTPLDLLSREKLHRNIFYEIRQLGILQSLIENPEITEIMVNGTSGIFIETKESLRSWISALNPGKADPGHLADYGGLQPCHQRCQSDCGCQIKGWRKSECCA